MAIKRSPMLGDRKVLESGEGPLTISKLCPNTHLTNNYHVLHLCPDLGGGRVYNSE